MSHSDEPISPSACDAEDDLDRIIERFEDAWQRGERPTIETFLPPHGERRTAVLVELVHIDLERRLKTTESVRVEEYVTRFTELAGRDDVLLELVASEHELRQRRTPSDSVAEYERRFPQLRGELTARLRHSQRSRPRRAMRVNCPDCRQPIEAFDDGSGLSVTCPGCGSSFTMDRTPVTSWQTERLPRIGKFQLLEAAGRGSFGTVYRARDTELDRIVAVKVPRSGQLATVDDEDRFVREARSVARLRHPGIVPVHEVGRSDTFPFIVCEFVEGVTLADWLTSRRVGFREAAELIALVADALEHAHRHGVVHRDLKPSNVMLETVGSADSTDSSGTHASSVAVSGDWGSIEFRPRLMDFGLARRDEGEVTVTVEGQPLGTPAYMSPEQARGDAHRVDGRSDVYSLGVILYELLAAEPPFRGNSRMLLHQVLSEEPRPPRRLNDRIPRDLETITLKCMAKEPSRRYPSAAELAADLRRWRAGEPIVARPIGTVGRAYRWCRRKPAAASLIAAIGLVCVSIVTGIVFWQQAELRWQQAEHRREQDRYQHLTSLRSAAEADESLARAELGSGRVDSAATILNRAVDRFTDEHGLGELRTRLLGRRDRVRRLVQFYRLADDAERLEFLEYDDEAQTACESALKSLNVLDDSEWWLHLPADDLTPERHEQLREDAYRQLLLLAALQAKRGLMNFASPSAADAYRSALATLDVAHAYRPSHAGRFAVAFCRLGLREMDKLQPLPAPEPTSATDYYFTGILHFWLASVPTDPISQIAFQSVRKLGGLDFDTPRATGEWMVRSAAMLEPKYYWHHFWLGMVLELNQNPKGAELAFNSCVALRPDFALAYSRRASALLDQWIDEPNETIRADLRRRATQDFERAVTLAPNEPVVYWTRAIAGIATGEEAEAERYAARAMELERPLQTLAGRRIFLEKQLHFATTREFAEQRIEADPSNSTAWTLRAMADWALGKHADAIDAANHALAIQENDSRALAVRGSVRLESGDLKSAREDFEAAVRLCRENFLAQWGKAKSQERNGSESEALEGYKQLLAIAATDWQRAEALLGKARTLAKLGAHKDARVALDEARLLNPKAADALATRISENVP